MAEVFISDGSGRHSFVDYSIHDGRVREFVWDGETHYSSDMQAEGWRETLSRFIRAYGLDVDTGRGLHAFVLRHKGDGYLAGAIKND